MPAVRATCVCAARGFESPLPTPDMGNPPSPQEDSLEFMHAIILAGGAGKRIHPLGVRKPKPLYCVAGKPLIQHVLQTLARAGVTDVVVVLGERGELIRDRLGDGTDIGVRVQYVSQARPLGQADALLVAEPVAGDRVLVANASDIHDVSLVRDMMTQMDRTGSQMVLAGREVDEPWRYGVMRFDPAGTLVQVVEKPERGSEPSKVAVLGFYLFTRRIFECIRATPMGETDDQFERAYQKLIDEGAGTYVRYTGLFEAFKYPWDLLRLNDALLAREINDQRVSPTSHVHDTAILDGPVHIDDGARVLENAVIRGPAYVGPEAIVGNNVLIRGGVSLGRGTVIGYGSEVKHAVLGDRCELHMAYVGDSILGDECALGAGTITANVRLDQRPVKVSVHGTRVSSGSTHLGTIMAEGSRTGCNATLMPGVKVGPDSLVGPGVVLRRDLPPGRAAWLPASAYEVGNGIGESS